jgi:alpha-tubulin suppressor-like RCC1 family protein
VLAVAFLQYLTSFTSILRKDYYSTLAKQAAVSGVKIAANCYKKEIHNLNNWPEDSKLTPNKDCQFNIIDGSSQYISEDKNNAAVIRTTYSVDRPVVDDTLITFTATGTSELFSSSTSSTPAFSFTETSKIQVPVIDGTSELDAARGLAVTDISTGLITTCAIANMSPYCWGANAVHQVGVATGQFDRLSPLKVNSPEQIPSSSPFVNTTVHSISTAPAHTCALSTIGTMFCWGMNGPFGGIGIGQKLVPFSTTPLPITKGAIGNKIPSKTEGGSSTSIALGADSQQYGCAIVNGRVSCVGQNFFAQHGQISYCSLGVDIFGGVRWCLFPWSPINLTAKFTMWAFGAGVIDYAANHDSDTYVTVFGYDKNAPGPHNKPDNKVEMSNVGKYNASEVSAGQTTACSNENGKIFCWGDNAMPWVYSQNGWTGGLTIKRGNVIDENGSKNKGSLSGKMAHGLSTSYASTCAISEGQAHCWGRDIWNRGFLDAVEFALDFLPIWDYSPSPIPRSYTENRAVTQIARSGQSSLACLIASGTPYCWGMMPGAITNTRPKKLENTPGFTTKIDSGEKHTCGIFNGSAYCFGNNLSGQIGDGTKTTRSELTKVHTIGLEDNTYAMESIDGGYNHTCGIVEGDVFCWGSNNSGQLGTGNKESKSRPTKIDTSDLKATRSTTAVSAGKNHTCAVVEGDIYCWGSNSSGQLGNNSLIDSSKPVRVNIPSGGVATDVAANGDHTCAVINGRAYCWGANSNGQLGTNNRNNYQTPQLINVQRNSSDAQRHVTKIAAGENFSCAIASERVWCWGGNDRGQLGQGNMGGDQLMAREVNIGSSSHNGLGYASTDLTVGSKFACTIVNGVTMCWGDNSRGQLGRGHQSTNSSTASPAKLSGSSADQASFSIAAGSEHACSITHGSTQCWGKNDNGQLGNGTSGTPVSSPVITHKETGVLEDNIANKLAAGDSHSCTIANGRVACWGAGSLGQLGKKDDLTQSSVPGWTHPKYAVTTYSYDWDRAVTY